MRRFHTYYRTADGLADYEFSIEKQRDDDTWRIYILESPDYEGRSEGLHATHRWTDSNDHYYVCWTEPIPTLRAAKAVAALWADSTQTYIRTGERF